MALQFLATALQVAGTLMSVKGGLDAAKAARVAGQRQRAAKESEAALYTSRAQQEVAAAQQRGFEEKRKAKLVASRAIALAASGGGGASDPTVMNLLADVEGEGAYRQAVRVYQGEEAARTLRYQAAGARYEGELAEEAGSAKARAYKTQAISSLLSGAGSLYGKYGGSPSAGGSNDFSYESYSGGVNRRTEWG